MLADHIYVQDVKQSFLTCVTSHIEVSVTTLHQIAIIHANMAST